MFVVLIGFAGSFAQTSCLDWNEYVDFKNTGGTGYYTLSGGAEENAAQTYHYSGPGNITDIRIDGQIPSGIGWYSHAHLTVSIYNVDINNRPTSMIASKNIVWYYWQSVRSVHFGSGGIPVSSDFAVVVEMSPHFSGQEFLVKYTGDGEGNLEDLPSVSGTSTGGNWVSILPAKDGDLYIRPRMNHFITADFSASATCNVAVSQTVNFTDMSTLSQDPMFNTIALSGYTGTETIYDWDFGDGSGTSTLQNPSYSYSAPGAYTVSLTTTLDRWPMGSGSCSHTKTMQVSVGLSVSGVGTDLSCFNDNSGSIVLSANGGDNSSYSYSLNGMSWQSSTTFSGLSAGTYTIFVRDGLGCEESGTSVTLTEPSAILIASPVGVTSATCGNNDGALLVSASGGTGTISYSLDNVTYQAGGAFSALNAGTYTVYAQDANGCVESTTVAVSNTTSPTLTLQSYTNVSCNEGNDGTITIIGSGGTGALQYSIDGVNFFPTGTFTGIGAGFYVPTVKDAAGCIGTTSCIAGPCGVTITEPTPISFSLSQSPALCNTSSDGEINVTSAIGGIGTIIYSLDGVIFQSGTNFSGLLAGFYTVTLKDAAGCVATDTITVAEPNAIIATVTLTTDLSCNASHDGALTISATGGDGNYSYSLDGINFFPSGDFNSLAAGAYGITVKDGNDCIGITTATLTEPSGITATVTTGNSTCSNADGTILAIATGGSGAGYTYSIDGGATSNGTGSFNGLVDSVYLVLVTDGAGCQDVFSAIVADSDGPTIAGNTSTDITCNGGDDGTITVTLVTGGTGTILYSVDGGVYQTSNVLTGLTAGLHVVVVEDANGCTGSTIIGLTEPSGFSIVLTGGNLNCYGSNDGTITVAAAGGAGTLAYSLDGISFQSPNVFNSLSAGTYTVTVRDAGGCTGTADVTITEPTEMVISLGTLNVTCFGDTDGAVIAGAVGGTGTIEYSLDGFTYQPSGNFTNLDMGHYTMFAQDGNGCLLASIFSITEPDELVISSVVSDVSCAGGDDGVIDITVMGGTTPFTYDWSTGSKNEDVYNLVAGNYNVTVTDANGCSASDNFTVTEPTNPIIINGTVVNASGATTADGSADITVTGGTAPYSYDWSNGATAEDISSLLPGVYVIIITDANGCTQTTSFTVGFSVGFSELNDAQGLNIYPNPAKDMINVELSADKNVERIELISMAGQVVYESNPNSNMFQVDVKFLAEGLYFINIYVVDGVMTKKIVVNR